jgi:hypothetical protein
MFYLKSMNLIKSEHLIYHHFVIHIINQFDIYNFIVLDYFSLACVRVLIYVFLFLEN